MRDAERIAALVPQNVDQLLGQVMHFVVAIRVGDGLREGGQNRSLAKRYG